MFNPFKKPASTTTKATMTPEELEEARANRPTETWDELKVKVVVKRVSPMDHNTPKPDGHLRYHLSFIIVPPLLIKREEDLAR